MKSVPKILGVISLSGGLVLCLNLSSVTLAAESTGSALCADGKGDQPNHAKCDEKTRQGIHTLEGDVLRVEYDNVIVRRSDGREVSLHIDENTEMIGYVGPGEHVKARVNEQRHALSIRLAE
jgi:hypothetical protein